jgi:hypothetical protein
LNFQQTSSLFKNSTYLSQTSVAAIHEIVQCAQTIANSKANGVFVVLDQVSPNRDSFAVKIAYRTDGNPNDWAVTQFNVQPPDPKFSCNGYEKASNSNPIKLQALTREIGCSKSPDKHLTLVVDTTQGGGVSIPLDSVHEEIQTLRSDVDSRIQGLVARLRKAESDAVTLKDAALGQCKVEMEAQWGACSPGQLQGPPAPLPYYMPVESSGYTPLNGGTSAWSPWQIASAWSGAPWNCVRTRLVCTSVGKPQP